MHCCVWQSADLFALLACRDLRTVCRQTDRQVFVIGAIDSHAYGWVHSDDFLFVVCFLFSALSRQQLAGWWVVGKDTCWVLSCEEVSGSR